jgi:hypothetical protein
MPCDGGQVWVDDFTTLRIDCDVVADGIQDECDVPADATELDVAIVFGNAPGESVGTFNFVVIDDNQQALDPKPGSVSVLDSNPDFNQEAITGSFTCSPPRPDLNPDPARAESFLSCFNGSGDGPFIGPEGAIELASVHYNVRPGANATSIRLEIRDGAISDRNLEENGSCFAPIDVPTVCTGATINIAGTGETPPDTSGPAATQTATFTPTPTVTFTATATATAVPTATNTPLPPATATPTLLQCADVDGNGRVDAEDLRLIGDHMGRRRFDPQYDVNGDGKVTGRDMAVAFRQLGRRC